MKTRIAIYLVLCLIITGSIKASWPAPAKLTRGYTVLVRQGKQTVWVCPEKFTDLNEAVRTADRWYAENGHQEGEAGFWTWLIGDSIYIKQ